MGFTVNTYQNQIIKSGYWDVASYLLGYNGIVGNHFEQCVLTANKNTMSIGTGQIVLFGKNIVIQGASVTVPLPTVQWQTYWFFIEVDMGANTVQFVYKTVSSQSYTDDLFQNPTTGKYSFLVGSALLSSTGTFSNINMLGKILYPQAVSFDANVVYPIGTIIFTTQNPPNIKGQTWQQLPLGYFYKTGSSDYFTQGGAVSSLTSNRVTSSYTLTQNPSHSHSTAAHTHSGLPNHTHSANHSHTIPAMIYMTSLASNITIRGFGGTGNTFIRRDSGFSQSINASSTKTVNGGTTGSSNPTITAHPGGNTSMSGVSNPSHNHSYDLPKFVTSAWMRIA